MDVNEISCITDKSTGKAACPLLGTEVSAVIDMNMAEVTLIQNYINTSPGSIEALYTFPLPHMAVVTGFRAKIGNDEVTGTYREREAAFEEYDDALRRGDSGFLLESHRPDIFQVSLGNIPGGETLTVTISYIEDVQCVDGELRWVLPTVVAPRYIPGKASGTKAGAGLASPTGQVPDADLITPPIGSAPYALKLKAHLKGFRSLKKITSPSHPIVIYVEEDGFAVTLAKENEPLNRDFVLNAVMDKVSSNRLILSHGGDGVFGELAVALELEDIPQQKNYEYTFVIDVSGSMAGRKLEQAKKALQLSLRNLIEGDLFNIVAFDSGFTCFSEAAVPYTQSNLEKADRWVASLIPLGGTEILQPLRHVLEGPGKENIGRVVLLFTDGQVGNEKEIIQLVRRNNKALNLFTFGIDTAVNRYFIESLAYAGNGLPEVIFPGERLDDKVIRQFSRIHQPFVSDGKILQANGAELETVPAIPSRLYGDEEYVFRFHTADAMEGLILAGSLGKGKFEVQIPFAARGDARLLSLKWAKERIRMLEESLGCGNPRRDERAKKEIVALSEKYGVLSTLTSLVAVYERFDKLKGMPETIVVPVARPEGWEMFSRPQPVFAPMSVMNMVTESATFYADNDDLGVSSFFRHSRRSSQSKKSGSMAHAQSEHSFSKGFMHKEKLESSSALFDDVQDLIREAAGKQKANGAFGEGDMIALKTSCFIIAMLLMEDQWKPYRIQIIKAGKALLGTADDALLMKAVAIDMLGTHKLIPQKDAINLLNEFKSRMNDSQNAILDTFAAGDRDILKKEILPTKADEPLAAVLLKLVIK
jgi:Ca-activated chloride channel family protein